MMNSIKSYSTLNKKKQLNKGFTLVEVLVALTVMSLGIAALISALTQSTNIAIKVEEKMVAGWVASNHLTDFKMSQVWPDPGEFVTEATMGGREWHIKQRVTQTENEDIRKVDIDVSTDTDFSSSESSLFAFIFNPRPKFEPDEPEL